MDEEDIYGDLYANDDSELFPDNDEKHDTPAASQLPANAAGASSPTGSLAVPHPPPHPSSSDPSTNGPSMVSQPFTDVSGGVGGGYMSVGQDQMGQWGNFSGGMGFPGFGGSGGQHFQHVPKQFGAPIPSFTAEGGVIPGNPMGVGGGGVGGFPQGQGMGAGGLGGFGGGQVQGFGHASPRENVNAASPGNRAAGVRPSEMPDEGYVDVMIYTCLI